MSAIAARRAELEVIANSNGTRDDGSSGVFPLLSIDDLATLPAPSFLLRDFIRARAFNVLYGPSGVGKSFLALDWALCVASGLPWYGQDADAGGVVYIAAEGVAGLYPRIAAWQYARDQQNVPRIRFIPEATNLLDDRDIDRARRTLETLDEPPALIVWDTMARSMIGGDENAARDVGLAIAAADSLAAPYEAARLFVHHTGKNGEDERGSSALRGASDLMMALKAHEPGLRLTCEKSKDTEPFEAWRMSLAPTADSCVMALGTLSSRPSEVEVQILEAVSESFGTDWTSATTIREVSGVPKTSVFRALNRLVESGFLAKDPSGSYPRYQLTADGLSQTVPDRSSAFHGTARNRSVPPPHLKGWNVERSGTDETPEAAA